MASAGLPEAIDWDIVQQELWQVRPAKLKTELLKHQSVFTKEQIDSFVPEEIAHHVLTLRKLLNQPKPLATFVKNFNPVPFLHTADYTIAMSFKAKPPTRRDSSVNPDADAAISSEEEDPFYSPAPI